MIIDFELFRILAILGGHLWNITLSTCKTIVSLGKVQAFDIFRKSSFESFCKTVYKGTHISFSKNYYSQMRQFTFRNSSSFRFLW